MTTYPIHTVAVTTRIPDISATWRGDQTGTTCLKFNNSVKGAVAKYKERFAPVWRELANTKGDSQ